ncbi:MAG: lamin tail domain-containing protein, partial [Bacteroidales bacterium]|nr:lamin tail domain-containing protein [Bacteroidales bacterium]
FVYSSQSLYIRFNEHINTDSALDTINYLIDQGIGYPEHVNPVSSKEVMLEFGSSFTEEIAYNINVTGIADLSGNIIKDYSNSFIWYFAKAFDIVINEIMADPDPSIELPSVEYVELYNVSAYPVNLNNWVFIAGTNGKSLSDVTIMPDSYLILCSEENAEYLTPFGKVMGISGFPVLTNTGKNLTLKNKKNHIISSVTYSDKWYKDDYKSEGGWSLEQIDPANPCGGIDNWKASVDYKGGTPGRANSVLGENPDFTPPGIRKAVIEEDNRLMVFFTESCDSLSALICGNYFVDHGFGNPDSVQLVAPHYSEALLFFSKPFMPKYVYTLELSSGLYDCAGNSSDNNNLISFGLPENPDSLDIIINEILFNPLFDGVDFVEIYNRSEKIIDLKLLNLATRDKMTDKLKSICPFSEEPALLFPSGYLAVTVDIPKLQEQYYFADPGALLQIYDMPSFSNKEGKVILTDKRQQVFDEFSYNEDMHFPLLSSVEGVSLERINFDNPTYRESNWHSAAENAGFGTPGYLNSQYSEYNESEKEVWLMPEVFSPDNDGVDDIVQIHFAFKDPGHVASVYVFDAKGRIIRHLIRNELLSVEGLVSWDGLDDMDQKAPVGIYLVYVEIFDLKGNVRTHKKT